MKIWALAVTGLLRLLRDRSNIFFVFIFPLAIIVLVGAQFGSGGPEQRIAITHDGGEIASAIVTRLEEEGWVTTLADDEAGVIDDVSSGGAAAGVSIPDGFDEALLAGETAGVGFVARPDSGGSLQPVVDAAVADATADVRVARILGGQTGEGIDSLVGDVAKVEAPGVSVETEILGESLFPAGAGQFSVGAGQQLVLFVFLITLTGSAGLIQSRQLGVSRRMLSTPTSASLIVVGEGMSQFLVGMFQGLYIIGVTLVVFGVDWGNPIGAAFLLVTLSAVGAGAAMLIGALFSNDQQAGGISVMLGLTLAALGGCMLPLELFSPTMSRIAHLTPHAWAVDGFSDLTYRGGGLGDVMGEVGVLAGYAAVLLVLAGWRLRSVLTRA